VRVTSENKVRFILIETGSNYKGIDSSVLTLDGIISLQYGMGYP
jgi:hypothetical protein